MVYSFSTLKQTKYLTTQNKQTNKQNKPICFLAKKQTKIEMSTTLEDSENRVAI